MHWHISLLYFLVGDADREVFVVIPHLHPSDASICSHVGCVVFDIAVVVGAAIIGAIVRCQMRIRRGRPHPSCHHRLLGGPAESASLTEIA